MSASDCLACGQFHGIDPSTGRCTYCGMPRYLAEMKLRERRDERVFDLQIATQQLVIDALEDCSHDEPVAPEAA